MLADVGTATLLRQQWMNPEAFSDVLYSVNSWRPFQYETVQRRALHAVADHQVNKLQEQFCIKQSNQVMPVVLTNMNIFQKGMSAEHLGHPHLPICVLGYRQVTRNA